MRSAVESVSHNILQDFSYRKIYGILQRHGFFSDATEDINLAKYCGRHFQQPNAYWEILPLRRKLHCYLNTSVNDKSEGNCELFGYMQNSYIVKDGI